MLRYGFSSIWWNLRPDDKRSIRKLWFRSFVGGGGGAATRGSFTIQTKPQFISHLLYFGFVDKFIFRRPTHGRCTAHTLPFIIIIIILCFWYFGKRPSEHLLFRMHFDYSLLCVHYQPLIDRPTPQFEYKNIGWQRMEKKWLNVDVRTIIVMRSTATDQGVDKTKRETEKKCFSTDEWSRMNSDCLCCCGWNSV